MEAALISLFSCLPRRLKRLNYLASLQQVQSEEDKLQLYVKHLSKCSTIGQDVSQWLEESIGSQAEKPLVNSPQSRTQNILKMIGLDEVSVNFFTQKNHQKMREIIQAACLKNEIQFQCALGFLGDRQKIMNDIETMKNNDGNVKLMFENECARPEFAPSVYSCIADKVDQWAGQCNKIIGVYNQTRVAVNTNMLQSYVDTLSGIEARIAQIPEQNSALLRKEVRESQTEMALALGQMVNLEAFKCRHFTQMARCINSALTEVCGQESAQAVEISLKVGYLRRERGDDLYEQFFDSGIAPHRACASISA
uniref:Secreted protein n=1 Tax=Steinernema glaseri TaxID=37863 RepID=A0A1I7Z4U1_9BILA